MAETTEAGVNVTVNNNSTDPDEEKKEDKPKPSNTSEENSVTTQKLDVELDEVRISLLSYHPPKQFISQLFPWFRNEKCSRNCLVLGNPKMAGRDSRPA
jgi:hypothetical protein